MHEHDKERAIDVEEVTCEVCLKNILTTDTDAQSEKEADNVAYFCGLDCYEKWKHQKLLDNSDYNINFLTGIYCLFTYRYQEARHFFLTAVTETDSLEIYHDVYLSYLGLSNVLIDHKKGTLHHCHHSSDISYSMVPEIQLNQACAEFIKGNRRLGIQAMDKCNDLKLSPMNSEEFHSLVKLVGNRRKDSEGLLIRDKLIYKSVGKLLRKKENFDVSDIEAFVINTAKNRYQASMPNQPH